MEQKDLLKYEEYRKSICNWHCKNQCNRSHENVRDCIAEKGAMKMDDRKPVVFEFKPQPINFEVGQEFIIIMTEETRFEQKVILQNKAIFEEKHKLQKPCDMHNFYNPFCWECKKVNK